MPYRDLLQDQIERFARALQTLLNHVLNNPDFEAVTQIDQMDAVLKEELDTDLETLLKLEPDALLGWLSASRMSVETTEEWVEALALIAQQMTALSPERSREIVRFALAVLHALNRQQNAVSTKRIELDTRLRHLTA